MAFFKSFAKQIPGSTYSQWVEITLTKEEEQRADEHCKKANYLLMDECLEEAKALAIKHQMNEDEMITRIATALFEKRSSHVAYWKEEMAKEKFDKLNASSQSSSS